MANSQDATRAEDAKDAAGADDGPFPLWRVLCQEYRALRPGWKGELDSSLTDPAASDSKKLAELFRIAHAKDDQDSLAALCFSGGGIRSATFNLGVLQGLARLGLLRKFDYLSSVSGGGYISGWLARWIHAERGVDAVEKKLSRAQDDPAHPEPDPVVHLRRYSNYLTPRLGALSADSWTLVAIVVRNLLLNWLVLLPILAALLALPLLAVACPIPGWLPGSKTLFGLSSACAFVGLFFMSLLRASRQQDHPWAQRFLLLGLGPLLLAVPLLLEAVFRMPWQPTKAPGVETILGYFIVWTIVVPLGALFASVLAQEPLLGRRESSFLWDAIAIVLAGIVEALIYAWVWTGWGPGLVLCELPLFPILGPGLVIGPMLLGRALFVALSSLAEHAGRSSRYGDADREWWARWSAWTLISTVCWMTGSALVLFAPTLLASTWAKVTATISAGGLGGLVSFLGKQSSTPAKVDSGEQSLPKRILLAFGVPLFAVALILVLSQGTQTLFEAVEHAAERAKEHQEQVVQGSPRLSEAAKAAPGTAQVPVPKKPAPAKTGFWQYRPPYRGTFEYELAAIVLLLAVGFVLGYPVNVNRFSLQALYRNRLVRAYLGASNAKRRPNLFTGFDPEDNIRLKELTANRPLPVINMALNLVRGENLAWQERKAESFTATPFHCGAAALGYRPTARYGGKHGISLGTAVATSGAAANPNMGFHSSPAVTFIMTLFNARLGIWLGNPGRTGRFATYGLDGPRSSARVIFGEALGMTDDQHPYVNLSDGGHFENLGLYEMVRRRCRYIVVCDAGGDPAYAFDDLGNAIRKIRIDLGIPILFEERVQIYPKPTSGKPEDDARYCAIAEIRYGEVDPGAKPGHLVYVKPAICDDSPYDVRNYSRSSRDFPQETTADQWFSESQFESYRALGQTAIGAMGKPGEGEPGVVATFDAFVTRTGRYIHGEKAAGTAKTA